RDAATRVAALQRDPRRLDRSVPAPDVTDRPATPELTGRPRGRPRVPRPPSAASPRHARIDHAQVARPVDSVAQSGAVASTPAAPAVLPGEGDERVGSTE